MTLEQKRTRIIYRQHYNTTENYFFCLLDQTSKILISFELLYKGKDEKVKAFIKNVAVTKTQCFSIPFEKEFINVTRGLQYTVTRSHGNIHCNLLN